MTEMVEITPAQLIRAFAENPAETLADPHRRAALIETGNKYALDTIEKLTERGWDKQTAVNAVRAAHRAAADAELEASRTTSE